MGIILLVVFAVLTAAIFGTGQIGPDRAKAQGTASVTIVKQGLLGEDVAEFTHDFTEDGSFVLGAAENSMTFLDLEAGTYHVTELPLEGYVLTGTGCSLDTSRSAPGLAPVEGNTLGITVADGQHLTCTFVNASTQVIQYDVTVTKLVDEASPVDGNFDLTSTWTAANLNDGIQTSGDFSLNGENGYVAVSSLMDAGAAYSVVENDIDGVCDPEDTHRLAGFSMGMTPEEAAAAELTQDASVDDLQSDWYIVVHNETCAPTGNSSITIVKEGLSGDAEAVFTHDVPGQDSDTFTLTADANSITIANLPAGTYNFTEEPIDGWRLISAGCAFAPTPLLPEEDETPKGNVLTVVLGEEEDQVCTFVNEQETNTVTVDKYVDGKPAVDGSFEFTESASDASQTFVLDAESGFGRTSAALPFGTSYSLTEDNVDATCDEGDTYRLAGYGVGATLEDALAAAPADAASIESLEADMVVVVWNQTCADLASITIVKDFQPDADAEASFTVEGFGVQDFTIVEGDENGRTFNNLNSGAYSFTEGAIDGWRIQSIFCTGQTNPSNILINLGGASATVSVNAGDHITCTFTNVEDASEPEPGEGGITIIKAWDMDAGPEATFTASGNLGLEDNHFTLIDDDLGGEMRAFEGLSPDTYTFTESAIEGWTLSAIDCTGIAPESIDIDLTVRSLGVHLADGEDVVCTFHNMMDTEEPVANPGALSPFTFAIPFENVPVLPGTASNEIPTSNIPSQGTSTTDPSSNATGANQSAGDAPNSANDPAPAVNNLPTVGGTVESPAANSSDDRASNDGAGIDSVLGNDTTAAAEATPAAPSTGTAKGEAHSEAVSLWLAGVVALVAGAGAATTYGLSKRR